MRTVVGIGSQLNNLNKKGNHMKERITAEKENLKKQNEAIVEGRAQIVKMEQTSLIIQGRIHMLEELEAEKTSEE
jgi:uncharacterized protein YoxC